MATNSPSAPRVLRILGQKIEVKFVKDVDRAVGDPSEHEAEGGRGRVGHADLRFGLLHVGTLQSEDQIADTYLHEALHIMLMMVGHDDEGLIFRLTPVLLDFLRQNPRFVEYVTKKRLIKGWW